MFGRYKDDNVSYGIVGLGRFGYALAKALARAGCGSADS